MAQGFISVKCPANDVKGRRLCRVWWSTASPTMCPSTGEKKPLGIDNLYEATNQQICSTSRRHQPIWKIWKIIIPTPVRVIVAQTKVPSHLLGAPHKYYSATRTQLHCPDRAGQRCNRQGDLHVAESHGKTSVRDLWSRGHVLHIRSLEQHRLKFHLLLVLRMHLPSNLLLKWVQP